MKVVINAQFGGFNLSHKGNLYYAKLCGFSLYPFVNQRGEDGSLVFRKFREYKDGDDEFLIHYSKEPLNKNGEYEDESYFSCRDIERNDPNLIKTVEDLGDEANGMCASLKIIEIPDDIEWQIEEYDGNEWVAEKHEVWS